MRIWIFNHHALTPEQGGGTRHFDYARRLVAMGHEVTIFAASFHYATYREFKRYPPKAAWIIERLEGVEFVWIRTRPYRGNGVGRVLNMLDYTRKALAVARSGKVAPPDVVVGSSVHLFAVWAACRVARRFRVPCVMEVRDLWPQTLIDMGISRWHPFILLLGWLERRLYRRAEAVVTNLPYAHTYIRRFVPEEKIHWIPNGADLARNRQITPHVFEGEGLHIVYAGAVGRANQIKTLLEAAALLKDLPVTMHIVGEGAERPHLEAQVRREGLTGVRFYGALPKERAVAMINGADLLFFPLADSPVFRYGIASNKLFDYLASGRPILFASNAANNPVEEAGAGITVPAEDPRAVAEAIRRFAALPPATRREWGARGVAYVRRHHDINRLSERFESLLRRVRYNFDKKEGLHDAHLPL